MTKVECTNVFVKTSTFSSPDNQFDGAFATTDIKCGEIVEIGIVRRLSNPDNKAFDGMLNPLCVYMV